MTGFGSCTSETERLSVSVELRAVNNRYLKVSQRLPDALSCFETRIEQLIRQRIARGAVQVSLRVRFPRSVSGFAIDTDTLQEYRRQLAALPDQAADQVTVSDLLPLPGVVVESELTADAVDSFWPDVETAVRKSLDQFEHFRQTEGRQMQNDLQLQCRTIAEQVDAVAALAPQVVAEYRTKLLERLQNAVAESGVSVSESDLIREVAVYADRCDINEEITRLRSHLQQFESFLNADQSQGRKLEFLGQEMFREINTIGSKTGNVAIAHRVVDMKAAIERIREILQNVE